ncbi:MAG: WG repeat-containing protein, partial [Bryobacteraceae bacterium]
DRQFQWVVPQQFGFAYVFSEGVAAVQASNRAWTYIDKQGTQLIEPRFELAYSFSDGVAAALIGADYRYVFLDRSLKEIASAPAGVIYVGQFSGGLIPAQLGSVQRLSDGRLYPVGSQNQRGFLDPTGKWAIAPQFAAAANFSEGLAAVQAGDKWGYIRPDGTFAIPSRFDTAEPFEDGLALVSVGGRYAVIQPDGHPIWNG